jgi:hypothetical protein
MSERQKQAEFLKNLLSCDDRPEHRDLRERLYLAERDERCMKRACRLVIVVTMFALAVLGYLTLLRVPDDVSRLSQFALRFCQALALGSAMCLGVFVGLLFWHRALINRLFAEGRKLITFEMRHPGHAAQPAFPTVIVHEGDTAVYHIRTQARTTSSAEIVTLPKVS